jgi:hypothetical protein
MSYSKDELKSMIREVVQDVLEKQHSQPRPSNEERIQKNVQIICEDGECYAGVIKEAKNFPYKCVNCGTPLPSSFVGPGTPPCPNCGSEEVEENESEE